MMNSVRSNSVVLTGLVALVLGVASSSAGPQKVTAAEPGAGKAGESVARVQDADSGADPFRNLPLVLDIDTAVTPPLDEVPAGASRVQNVLGRQARVLTMGDEARRLVYRVGQGAGLKAGQAYLLEVEYPDDVPRAFFMANRAADFVRGWATGTAVGDARRQYVEPSVESLAYPQSGSWTSYRQLFVMQERLQGVLAHRNPDPGCRPFTPADGFHVVFFQTRRVNDPRAEGLALGHIRLYAVPELAKLYAPLRRPPAELPQRRVFWREEMSDQAISARAPEDRAFANPLDWFAAKLHLARVLGIDTLAKDLLEFGFNQGWESGDPNWTMDAQPPLNDLWTKLVPLAAREGFTLLPYYEYKGSLGLRDAQPQSLGWQRRAEKLYHGLRRTADAQRTDRYTGTWWVEDSDADLTDPDTLADLRRVLDRTVLRFRGAAPFAGVWLRTRQTHLPISFSEVTIGRFRAAFAGDPEAQKASRAGLIASYEGDGRLYNRYIEWWLRQRAAFLAAVHGYLAKELGAQTQVLFTAWTTEEVPDLRPGDSYYHGIGVVTDDPAWWQAYARSQTDDWYRWKWVPIASAEVAAQQLWARTLSLRPPINDSANWGSQESYHSAPGADPEHYRDVNGVMLTYPVGRLFTVAGPAPMTTFQARAGLTVVHHYTLNENDENWDKMDAATRLAQPFQAVAGYVAADVDRAGPHVLLNEARAVAYGDARNIGFLCASNFSTGFPLQVRRFVQAFVAVPALPSRFVAGAASDADVVVREVATEHDGTYYWVVNPTWYAKAAVRVTFPAAGERVDLVTGRKMGSGVLTLSLEPAGLRAYHVQPGITP
jgi:hypothetical protein